MRKQLGVAPSGSSDAVNKSYVDAIKFPDYISGHYYYSASAGGSNTGSPTNTTPRVLPVLLSRTLSIARIGAEFTVAGDANSVVRIGVWNDDGTGIPGTLNTDCGTISTGTGNAGGVATGGTPGTYEITLGSTMVLLPGLYWFGAATQAAPTTVPTMRVITASSVVYPLSQGTSKPGTALSSAGFVGAAQTGAFGSFTTPSITTNICRLFFKVA